MEDIGAWILFHSTHVKDIAFFILAIVGVGAILYSNRRVARALRREAKRNQARLMLEKFETLGLIWGSHVGSIKSFHHELKGFVDQGLDQGGSLNRDAVAGMEHTRRAATDKDLALLQTMIGLYGSKNLQRPFVDYAKYQEALDKEYAQIILECSRALPNAEMAYSLKEQVGTLSAYTSAVSTAITDEGIEWRNTTEQLEEN